MHPPAAPSPAPGCWTHRPPRATGARRSAWPSWRRCSNQARQSVWPPCWPWPRRAWIWRALPPPRGCCWRPRYQRARWPTTAGPWARPRPRPWPAPRWPCCRAFTSATPTSSAPTAPAGAAWPRRAWRPRCGRRCWRGWPLPARWCCAARWRTCPATARSCRPPRSASRKRSRPRWPAPASRVPGRATWRAMPASPSPWCAPRCRAWRAAASCTRWSRTCSTRCPPWRNWQPWRAKWARRTTAWYWRHSFAT